MTDFRRLLRSIDIQRLSGLHTILGIDLSEESARIVELKKSGNPLLRLNPRFRVLSSFRLRLPSSASLKEQAAILREELREQYVRSRAAVATLRTAGIKTASATIPPSVQDPTDWIRENTQKVLRLPVRQDEISFQFEIIRRSEAGSEVEITFVRNSDIERCRNLFKEADVELLAMSAGVRDILSAYLVGVPSAFKEDKTLVHVSSQTVYSLPVSSGKRLPSRTFPLEESEDPSSLINRSVDLLRSAKPPSEDPAVMVASDGAVSENSISYELLKPFNLEAHFALAAGLAVKGFVPELSPVNFLPLPEQERVTGLQYRSLAQRALIGLGALSVVLLGLPLLLSLFLRARLDSLDERLAEFSPQIAEVTELEQEVAHLESKLNAGSASLQRTNVAKLLHEVAAAVPGGLWLTKAVVHEEGAKPPKLTISGYARSHDLIAQLLRALERSPVCSDPQLVKAVLPGDPTEQMTPATLRTGYVMFEIAATARL